MIRVFEYFGRAPQFRGTLIGLPAWARAILLVAALPGLIALSLSFAAVLVSLFALLLLTVPTYRLLSAVTGGRQSKNGGVTVSDLLEPSRDPGYTQAVDPLSGRRHVDVKIVEPQPENESSKDMLPPPGAVNESDYG